MIPEILVHGQTREIVFHETTLPKIDDIDAVMLSIFGRLKSFPILPQRDSIVITVPIYQSLGRDFTGSLFHQKIIGVYMRLCTVFTKIPISGDISITLNLQRKTTTWGEKGSLELTFQDATLHQKLTTTARKLFAVIAAAKSQSIEMMLKGSSPRISC